MQIDVTQKHINMGRAGDPDNCMVALALAEATGVEWSVRHWRPKGCRSLEMYAGRWFCYPIDTETSGSSDHEEVVADIHYLSDQTGEQILRHDKAKLGVVWDPAVPVKDRPTPFSFELPGAERYRVTVEETLKDLAETNPVGNL